jgi:hypothetical protein
VYYFQLYESSDSSLSNFLCILNRYLNNHLRSTLTVCWQGKPGRHLKQKLCLFMRPKCHPIFFDSNINSAAVVRLNIYQAFLLCAMKFHCYICDLSYLCKLRTGFYLSIIGRSLRYACDSCSLIKSACCYQTCLLSCSFPALILIDILALVKPHVQ